VEGRGIRTPDVSDRWTQLIISITNCVKALSFIYIVFTTLVYIFIANVYNVRVYFIFRSCAIDTGLAQTYTGKIPEAHVDAELVSSDFCITICCKT
jgi:hypothetical protein